MLLIRRKSNIVALSLHPPPKTAKKLDDKSNKTQNECYAVKTNFHIFRLYVLGINFDEKESLRTEGKDEHSQIQFLASHNLRLHVYPVYEVLPFESDGKSRDASTKSLTQTTRISNKSRNKLFRAFDTKHEAKHSIPLLHPSFAYV